MMDSQLADGSMSDIVRALPVPAFLKDSSSRFISCSQGLADYAEMDPEKMTGKFDTDMPWATPNAAQFRDWDRRIMETGESVLKIAETIRTASGNTPAIETSKFPVRDSQGHVVGVLGHFKEVRRIPVGHEDGTQTPRVVEEMVMRYLGGETIAGIASATASAPLTVYAVLRDRGVVDRWQSNPAEWARYPVFSSAVRAFRLALMRDEVQLEAQQVVGRASAVALESVRKQIAALNLAIAEADLPLVRGLVDVHFQNRVRELLTLISGAGQSGGVVFGWQWAEDYTPLVMCSRYVAELERIDADRRAIDRESRGQTSN